MNYPTQPTNRPINQTNLFGFKKYFTIFKDLYNKNLFPNKILLSGISGLGKATFAYHFINFVLSINEKNNYNFLDFKINNLNRSFHLIQKNAHPNFFLIDLIEDQQSIDINQVRNMINYSNKTTFNQNKKFILIDNVENLNAFSVNALLKTIEQPNDNTSYILIHDSSKPIVQTLKSRCIEFKILFSNKEKKDIIKKLFEQNLITNHLEILDNLTSYYDSPGFLLKLYNIIVEDNDLNDAINCDDFLVKFINVYKNNIKHGNFALLRNILEFSIYKKLINSKNKTNIYLLYSRLINKIDVSIKYNLDLNNLFFEISKKYREKGFSFSTVIHPSAILSAEVEIEEGVQIMAGATIQRNVKIGKASHAVSTAGCCFGVLKNSE